MGNDCTVRDNVDSPLNRAERSNPYVNWCLSITVASSDGYRNHRLELQLNDGWNGNDPVGCVETLAMSAAHLIKSVEAAGLAVYGGDATAGFSEAYRD
jgi:hypothetical protein